MCRKLLEEIVSRTRTDRKIEWRPQGLHCLKFNFCYHFTGLFMRCPWTLHEVSVDSSWGVRGLFMRCPRTLPEVSAESSWSVRGLFLRCLWTLPEVSMDSSWGVCGLFLRCPRTLREVSSDSLWCVCGCFSDYCALPHTNLHQYNTISYLAIPRETLSYVCPVPYNSIFPKWHSKTLHMGALRY